MEKITTIEQLSKYDHDYYCSDSSYYSLGFDTNYKTWDDFVSEMEPLDEDYNLIFRWDVKEKDLRDFEDFNSEEDSMYYLELFMVHQRKGRFVPLMIENVFDKDIEDIMDFLDKRYKKLLSLWQPFQ